MKKIALWLIYLFMICSPLEFVINGYVTSALKYIALIAVVGIVLYFIIEEKNKLKFGVFQLCLVAWGILEAASILWTPIMPNTSTMISAYITMAAFVVLVSLIPFTKKEIDNLMMFYSLGCLILAIMLLVGGKMDGGNAVNRYTISIFGKYQDPNWLAAILIGGAFYSLNKVFERKGFVVSALYAVSFLAQSMGIMLSGSRGGLVAYALALVVYALIKIPRKKRIFALLIFALLVVGGYFLLKAVLPDKVFERLFDISDYISSRGTGRMSIWNAAFSEILKRPLFGRGIISYNLFFLYEFGSASAMHNTFLAVLYEVGIVGFIFFITPFLRVFKNALEKKNALMIALLVGNLTAAFFIDAIHLRFIWNALIFGITWVNYIKSPEHEKDSLEKKGE